MRSQVWRGVRWYFVGGCLLIVGFTLQSKAPAQSSAPGYHIVDSLRLGGEGGWDYLTVDPTAHRVYVSRGTHMQVVDTKTLTLLGDLPNTPGIHGIALVPALNKGYTSNGRDSSVTEMELTSLKFLRKIRIDARNPDAILYEPISGRIFTFNGGSGNVTAIDPAEDNIVGTIPAGGKPEFCAYDGAGHVFVNIEDKSLILEFDARSLAVVKSWSIAPGEEPSGLAIDRKDHRLFSVCRNKRMIISDYGAGTVSGEVPIGAGVDGAAYDSTLGLAFSSNGEGSVTVVGAGKDGTYAVLESVPTRRGARTCALDETTHRLYTITAEFEPVPEGSNERPHLKPGTATLYVIAR